MNDNHIPTHEEAAKFIMKNAYENFSICGKYVDHDLLYHDILATYDHNLILWAANTLQIGAKEVYDARLQIKKRTPAVYDVVSVCRLKIVKLVHDSKNIIRLARANGENLLTLAATNTDMAVLDWLYDHGIRPTSDTMIMALKAKNCPAIRWLIDKNCPYDKDVVLTKNIDRVTIAQIRKAYYGVTFYRTQEDYSNAILKELLED
jgi:hypothetical protein